MFRRLIMAIFRLYIKYLLYNLPINIVVLDEYTPSTLVTCSLSSRFDAIGESMYMYVT